MARFLLIFLLHATVLSKRVHIVEESEVLLERLPVKDADKVEDVVRYDG